MRTNLGSFLYPNNKKLRKCLQQEFIVQVKSQNCRLRLACLFRYFVLLAIDRCKPFKDLAERWGFSYFHNNREIHNVLLGVQGSAAKNGSQSLYVHGNINLIWPCHEFFTSTHDMNIGAIFS